MDSRGGGGEGFDQQVVERFTVGKAAAELLGLGAQVGVGELLERGLELVDRADVGFSDPLELAVVVGAEDLGEYGIEHGLATRRCAALR